MPQHIALRLRRASLWTKAIVIGSVGMLPALMPATVGATPSITSRTLSSTTAQPGQATDLTWTFNTTADAGNANTIEVEFCDTPLGTCTTVNTPTLSNTPTATLGGPWTTTAVTSTTRDAVSVSGGTDTQYTITKTNNDDASTKTGLTISFGATDVTNNAVANKSYYTRVRIYDNNPTLKWEGVFAQSTSQTLTVNARVQERLDFCVGSTVANDATTSVGAQCINVTGTAVNLGNVEGGQVNVSPVATVNGGDATPTNGVAMVRTNAVNGVVIDYKALQDTSSGQLKVPGASCGLETGVVTTDQCFNSADSDNDPSNGASQMAIAAGTEKFGMTIAGINCGSTTAYTCDFSQDNYNLRRDADYDGNGTTGVGTTTFNTEFDQVAGTTAGGYSWLSSGAADRIASSTASAVKVLDDEAMILKFAATAGITTPTGSYTVQADFIATATF